MQYRPERWDISTPVTLRVGDETVEARAQSASSTGVGIETDLGLSPHAGVTLVSNGQEFAVRVAWVSGTRAGLEFEVPQTRKALIAANLRGERRSF